MLIIGPNPVFSSGGGLGATVTWVDHAVAANEAGSIIKLLFTADGTGTLYVGVFRWNGSAYECMDATSFSVIASGYQEKAVSLSCQTGDYIGFYGVQLSGNNSSGEKNYSISGNKCIVGQTVPTTYPYTREMCLQGQGETPVLSGGGGVAAQLVAAGNI